MASQAHLDGLFERLKKSGFRSRFHLGAKEKSYLASNGMAQAVSHARVFVRDRLAPAYPKNDGKQTPMRGHPVFVAQHATATCCRGCFEKWHGIPRGRELTADEQHHAVEVIASWLAREVAE